MYLIFTPGMPLATASMKYFNEMNLGATSNPDVFPNIKCQQNLSNKS